MSDSSSLKVFVINWSLMELSSEQQSDNTVLSTVWIGPNSSFPHRKVIFNDLLEEMKHLSTDGIDWSVDGLKIHSHVFVSIVACDSQERWPLAGLSSFHNPFGCTMCTVRAENWQDPNNATLHKKVYLKSTVRGLKRNDGKVNEIALRISRLDDVLRETARFEVEYQGVVKHNFFLTRATAISRAIFSPFYAINFSCRCPRVFRSVFAG